MADDIKNNLPEEELPEGIIELTDEGRALQTDIDRVILEANHDVLAAFTPEEQATLKGWLEKICETCHALREE